MRTYRVLLSVLVFVLWIPAVLGDQGQAGSPRVTANDNRTPAGTLANGVLELKLAITTGHWYPEDERGTGLTVRVFAEEGKTPVNPGPLIRVQAGTEIHVTVRNQLGVKFLVEGLRARPSEDPPLEVDKSKTAEVRFRADTPGTYTYRARTEDPTSQRLDSQLAGVFVVDGPNQRPDDRLFVVNLIEVPADAFHAQMGTFVVNGKSWPFNEHLTYRVGEHARWRWINLGSNAHPMHLHGAYFNVTGVGSGERDTVYRSDQVRSVVTEPLSGGGKSFSVDWVPERTGRWLFHCHLAPHFTPDNQLPRVTYPESWGPEFASPAPAGPSHGSHDSPGDLSTASAGMASLVMGITVVAGDRPVATALKPRAALPDRRLELVAAPRSPGAGNIATMGYTVRERGRTLSWPGSETMVSPPIVLAQGQPVEVTISNRLKSPTAVHWHGIELDSYYDGVAGWGGEGRQVTPAIAPGGSFVARFTPPRAGTFIYHTHWHDTLQLEGGLYGPLIVLPPGQTYDPDTDKIVLIGNDGPPQRPLLVNGTKTPEPMVLRVGKAYRFRLINLTSDDPDVQVSLLEGNDGLSWRLIAKDGADLPPSQQRSASTRGFPVSVGETFDVEFVPEHAGPLTLNVFIPLSRLRVVTKIEVR